MPVGPTAKGDDMKFRRFGIATIFLSTVLLFVPSSYSGASTQPLLQLTIPVSTLNAGSQPSITYSSNGLAKGSSLYLQRQFGTAKVWKSVLKLTESAGTATAPSLPMGAYSYRLFAVNRRNSWTSPIVGVFVYGEVPLSSICNTENEDYGTGDCASPSATVQIGGNLFEYAIEQNWGLEAQPPSWSDPFSFPKNTCNQLVITYGLSNSDNSTDTANLEVIQTTLDPEYSSTPYGQLGTFTAELDGGPWNLEANTTSGATVYENGYAMCYTSSGQ